MEELNKELDCVKDFTSNISSKLEAIPRSDYLKELNKKKEIEREALYLQNLEKEKEYNEKVSNTIFGTGMRPSVVGNVNSDNPHMNYDLFHLIKLKRKTPLNMLKKINAIMILMLRHRVEMKRKSPLRFL